MLVTSISPFSHNVFYTIKDRNYHLCYIYFVVCKCFEFGQGQIFGNGLQQLYGFYRKLASEFQLRPTFTFFSQIIKYLSLTLIFNLQFAIMGFFNAECRSRSACTCVQSDLDLHSPLLYQ